MTRAGFMLLALLACTPAAADPGGFVEASVGVALRDPDNDKPYDLLGLEYDDGTLARLEVGTQYESGLQLRVGYTYTAYDALQAGSLLIAEDIQQQELRLGVFRASERGVPLGWRLGGGYAYADEDDNGSDGRYQRGGFVEVAAVIEAGSRLTLDLATAVMKLGGPEDYDAEAAELRVGAAFHTRVMDFTLGARYALFDRERFDEQLLELRIGVGGVWSYPEGVPY